MNTLELSMGETIVLAMALRILLQQEMSPRDREIAMLLECKLRLSYKGKKYRVMLSGEE